MNIKFGAAAWLQQQMGDCVWDNGLILAMGSIFETASIPGVNEHSWVFPDELMH